MCAVEAAAGNSIASESRKRWREHEAGAARGMFDAGLIMPDLQLVSRKELAERRPTFFARGSTALADLLLEMRRDLDSWKKLYEEIVVSNPSADCIARILEERLRNLSICVERLERLSRPPAGGSEQTKTPRVSPTESTASTVALDSVGSASEEDATETGGRPDVAETPGFAGVNAPVHSDANCSAATVGETSLAEASAAEASVADASLAEASAAEASVADASLAVGGAGCGTDAGDAVCVKKRRVTENVPGVIEVVDAPDDARVLDAPCTDTNLPELLVGFGRTRSETNLLRSADSNPFRKMKRRLFTILHLQ